MSAQQISDIPTKQSDDTYTIKGIGKRSTVKVLRTTIFGGTTKNIFYSEFEAENNEVRSSQIAQLGGYIVDKNGIVVPVQFATVKDKLSPNGKALLSAWATIPKSFDTTSYKLILGQAISSVAVHPISISPSSTGTGQGLGREPAANPVLVNMVSYGFNASPAVISSDFNKISFAGYTLGLHNINAYMSVQGLYEVNGLKLRLNYSLAKNSDYEIIHRRSQATN